MIKFLRINIKYEKDKDKIKELSKELTKEEFIDFILKLDLITMHLLTGPIHFIDALLGWDISTNIKSATKKATNIFDDIKRTFNDLKQKIKKAFKEPEPIKKIEQLEQELIPV